MESQKTQSFAKGSCFYQFFSLTIRVVEGYFLIQVLAEGSETSPVSWYLLESRFSQVNT